MALTKAITSDHEQSDGHQRNQTSTVNSSTSLNTSQMSGCCAQILWNAGIEASTVTQDAIALLATKFSTPGLTHRHPTSSWLRQHSLSIAIESCGSIDTMANAEHAPAMAPPVRTDEQILPRIRWVPIGKSNCYLNEEKSQPSPIFKIAVDILKQTNFFRAFTASSTIPAIYIQQFWDTICFDSKAGSYKCQLDEQWFDLTQDTLRDALQITPVDKNQAFSPPPTPDTLIEFVNELGYPREVIHLSNVTTNDMFQPWRALITIINLCLTGKTSGFERPRAPVLQEFFVGSLVNRAHIDYHPSQQSQQNKPNKTHQQIKPTKPPPKASSKKPKPAPVKPQEKKRKPVLESSEAPPLAKRAKAGKVVKKRTAKSSKQLVDEFIDEGVPAAKPRLEDTEEEILEKVLQESLTDAYPTQKGPFPPVVFRETDTGKLQPLPEVPRKGKEKVAFMLEVAQDEGQAGPDPGKLDEGQAGPNPDDVAESQPYQLLVTSAMAINSLMINRQKPNYEKTTADTEAESMVSITITRHHYIPPMTSPVIATTTTTLPLPPQPQQGPSDPIIIKRMGELEELIANLVEENQALEERLDKQGSRINKLETMDLPKMIREQTVEFIDSQEIDRKINESVKEVVISSVKHAMRAPLRARFKDLPTSDMKEIMLQRMLEENYDKGHAVHRVAYEALQDSIRRDECEDFDVDKAQEETKKKSKQELQRISWSPPPSPPPPPPPPSGASGASGTTGASDSAQAPPPPPPSSSTHQGGQSTSTAAPSSSKTAALAEYSAWTTTDTRIKPSITMIPDDLYMDDETTADEQAYSSGEEVGHDHIPTVNLRQSWWKPLTEDRPASPEPAWTIPSSDLPVPTNNWASALKTTYVPPPENSLLAQTGDIATFMDWYCKRQGISELTPKDLEGPAYEIVKSYIRIIFDMRSQDWQTALSISKMKAALSMSARATDSHLKGDRRAVETSHAYLKCCPNRILLTVWVRYIKRSSYRRADLKEYVHHGKGISNNIPSDFEDPVLFKSSRPLEPSFSDDKKFPLLRSTSGQETIGYPTTRKDFQLGAVTFKTDSVVQMIMQDKSRDEYKILDAERLCQKQGVHVRYPEMAKDMTYLLESGELC
ncbi:hypothetical protein Tco_0153522 [Tanacetum coccineum]